MKDKCQKAWLMDSERQLMKEKVIHLKANGRTTSHKVKVSKFGKEYQNIKDSLKMASKKDMALIKELVNMNIKVTF